MGIESLYGEILLDHSKHPRNYGKSGEADVRVEGANPLCGDEIELSVKIQDGVVEDMAFVGKSCAICTASTSMFCERAVGLPVEALDRARELFHRYLHGEELTGSELAELGEAQALAGVAKLPARVKCALLVFETWAEMKKRLIAEGKL